MPLALADAAWRYCVQGGIGNAAALLRFLSDQLLATAFGSAPPSALAEVGIYQPRSPLVLDWESWRREFARSDVATVAVLFYRSHWVTGNLAPVEALLAALEARGLNALAVFGPNLGAIRTSGLVPADQVDLLIATTSFSAGGAGAPLADWDVPVLQAIFCASSENVWAANIGGLTPRDLAMNVALPEFDGRIVTTAVSFKNEVAHDATLQTPVVRYQPRPDRIEHVAGLARNWARLRQIPNRQKRVAILLANYPSKNARVGNAVGLGRNFYSLDLRAIPTPTAWRVGCAAADALLQRHRERSGSYPESVALVVWGMIARLLEAAERGLWEQPEPATLARLKDQHGANDAWLEGGR